MRQLSSIMLVGTGSDVGKSVLVAALCRIFKQDGLNPAPFKAQNMALNSYATPDGREIGRAQAMQAEAAGIDCVTDMNPLLLKPQADHTSQVVLHGVPRGSSTAVELYKPECREQMRSEVCAAYDRLAAKYNPIVLEGAGSISEINLRAGDIVNLPMAHHAKAKVILVGDIDRGGVFASVYGSIMLQSPEDRALIKGIIINKFRGDMRLFDEGRRMMEELCGVPVLGVVPYFKDIHIEEEDSVVLQNKERHWQSGKVNVAVVMLRHISNFTDFDALEHDDRIHLFYTANPSDLQHADIIVLPGSKTTISDLTALKQSGLSTAIIEAHRRGKTIVGICGGYQMLGTQVLDPLHIEGEMEVARGLGLLPSITTLGEEKATRQVCFTLNVGEDRSTVCHGYEIHQGHTVVNDCTDATPLLNFSDGKTDGLYVDDRCMGTYVHGIFDNRAFVDCLLRPFAKRIDSEPEPFDYQVFKQEQYDLLAEHVRQHVDIDAIYQIMQDND